METLFPLNTKSPFVLPTSPSPPWRVSQCLGHTHKCPVRGQSPRFSSPQPSASQPPPSHLHHQHDGVQGDHGHDGVLKGWRHHKVPDAVLKGVPVLGHVAGERFGADGEVDARSLQEGHTG